ncbi:MAG: MurR/RpiR family transcriptional regulator [Alphaproteobacteria bacterium]|nr:MurR/RpiR family transcriptional regulator [Alphaproteobacteria bacterium]
MGRKPGTDRDHDTMSAHYRVLPLVRSQLSSLPVALRRIGKYVLDNPDLVIHQSASELALVTKSGPATVMRFCRVLGYAGYRKFKLELAGDLATRQLESNERKKSSETTFDELFERVVEAVRTSQLLYDPDVVERLASALSSARRIDVYGGGVSGLMAQYLEFRLLRIGRPVHAILDPTLATQLSTGLGPDSVAIAVSESGLTEDVMESLRRAHAAGATTAVITHRRDAPIAKYADEVLLTAAAESPLTGSKTIIAFTHLMMIELLASAVTVRMGLLEVEGD